MRKSRFSNGGRGGSGLFARALLFFVANSTRIALRHFRKPHLYSVDGVGRIGGALSGSRQMRCFKKRKGVNARAKRDRAKNSEMNKKERKTVARDPAYFICRGLFCLASAILLPYFSHNALACMSLISRDTLSLRAITTRSGGETWCILTSYHSVVRPVFLYTLFVMHRRKVYVLQQRKNWNPSLTSCKQRYSSM